MSELYVPLALFLRPVEPQDAGEKPPLVPPATPVAPSSLQLVQTVSAARRFRAALADALEVSVNALLPAIARDVLGRDLRLAETDVAAIVNEALNRFSDEEVLRVRVHPHDFDALAGLALERIADEALEPGDVRIDLRSGTIDLTLSARLDEALAALP
jgi:flagellar biosynthesis/type III secretory pathway protein FliH